MFPSECCGSSERDAVAVPQVVKESSCGEFVVWFFVPAAARKRTHEPNDWINSQESKLRGQDHCPASVTEKSLKNMQPRGA